MTQIKKQLDGVISRVNKKLAAADFVIPIKTENGILVGNILIVPNGTQKDLYCRGELLYAKIHLNKCAVKMANLLALNKDHSRVQELYRLDSKFGKALADYQIFKEKLYLARSNGDQFKIDLYLARLSYARDSYEYFKKQALRLAA